VPSFLTGYTDTEVAAGLTPRLSTTRLPFEESGGRANVAGRRPGAVESRGEEGARLIVEYIEYIEKFWCPTLASADLLAGGSAS
jgi:hypothetical protein